MIVELLILTVLINNIKTQYSGICEKCVAKCCPPDQYVLNTDCKPKTSDVPDFSTISVYDEELNVKGSITDYLKIVTNPVFKKDGAQDLNENIYIYENSSLLLSFLEENVTIDNDQYCADFYFDTDKSNETYLTVWFVDDVPTNTDQLVWLNIKLTALLISSFFLLLVIIAYSLVKQLRDLKGKIRLAFVINLFGAYFSLACLQIYYTYISEEILSDKACLLFSTIIFYFYWASSCWMNVSIYNIWVAIRGYRTVAVNQPEFRELDRRTFLRLCAYAFGVPCVLVMIFNIMHFLKGRSEIINIIIPNGECSITNKNNFNYYLYGPMFISNMINCVFYVLIAKYLWIRNRQVKRQLKIINGKDTQKISFIMHIKIWTLTGVTWILEVISAYFVSDSKWWFISDLYNIFMGVGLFIILICNKQTLQLFLRDYNINGSRRKT